MKELYRVLITETINGINTRVYLFVKSMRRNRAIKLAEKQSKLNNGRKYYVIKHPARKGRYIVRHKEGLDRLKRVGLIKKDLNFMNYHKEAVYITKSK